MFDLLRKKISTFVGSLAGKVESQPQGEAQPAQEIKQEQPQAPAVVEVQPAKQEPVAVVQLTQPRFEETAPAPKQPKAVKPEPVAVVQPSPAPKPIEQAKHEPAAVVQPKIEAQQVVRPKPVEQPVKPVVPQRVIPAEVSAPAAPMPAIEKPREFVPAISLVKKITGIFSSQIELTPGEVSPILDELEMALLESDVSYDASRNFVADLRSRLVGIKVSKSNAEGEIKSAIRESLRAVFAHGGYNFFEKLSAIKAQGRPVTVLFVGPNGAGKTTTIAKLASILQKRGFTSVISASDTFRKAAIEQAEMHGKNLDVRVIKHGYGADPTAVAFDAIAHAKAGKIDVVLIDTAGRQETNTNLVREMEKMARVLNPDIKVFVGEAIAGNALTEQVAQFNSAIKLDAVILTKLDCDAKGGGALSIAAETKLPIIFVGLGQNYGDLQPFDAEWLVESVLAA